MGGKGGGTEKEIGSQGLGFIFGQNKTHTKYYSSSEPSL